MNSKARMVHDLEKFLNDMRASHRGLPIWLLNERQLEEYRDFQRKQSERMCQYETEYGPGSYYSAYLDGSLPGNDEQLSHDIRQVLDMDREPTTIPIDATQAEAADLYMRFLERY